jgi:hypothetical protein
MKLETLEKRKSGLVDAVSTKLSGCPLDWVEAGGTEANWAVAGV